MISTSIHRVTKVEDKPAIKMWYGNEGKSCFTSDFKIHTEAGESVTISLFSDNKENLQVNPGERELELEAELRSCIAFLKRGEQQPVANDPQDQDTNLRWDELDVDAQIEEIELALKGCE